MLIFSIILLLLSAAVNNKRDSSILFSRITILALINSLIVLSINFNINFINEGLILYGGLFVMKNYILVFIIFTLLVSTFIISINAFYPRYFFEDKSNNSTSLNKILNRMAYEYRIVEYPLIILFCLTGAVFLMCSYDIISIFLSIELQSYGLYLLCSIYINS
jgi:NADH-ubiquinone oxidoreductase chain 2